MKTTKTLDEFDSQFKWILDLGITSKEMYELTKKHWIEKHNPTPSVKHKNR